MSFSFILLLIVHFSIPSCFSASLTTDTQNSRIPVSGERRMLSGSISSLKSDEPTNYIGNSALNPLNPMNSFLNLKPFLPIKPTFFPPFVDPNIFIDKKAKMLDNMFSPPTTRAATETGNLGPKTSAPFAINPKFFINKKTEFLSNLFGQLYPTNEPSMVQSVKRDKTPDVVPFQRRLVSESSGLWDPAIPPAEIIKAYTDKKASFLDKLFKTIQASTESTPITNEVLDALVPTAKPTIVPPSFWLPSFTKKESLRAVTSADKFSFMPQAVPGLPKTWGPIPSPADKAESITNKKMDFLEKLFSAISASSKNASASNDFPVEQSTTIKPTIVPPDFWIPSYVKSLKPSVPDPASTAPDVSSNGIKNSFIPFAPLVNGVPIVDPSVFIDKKQDFLNKLFDSLSTISYASPVSQNAAGSGVTYSELYSQVSEPSKGEGNLNPFVKRHDSEKIRLKDLKQFLQIIDDNSDVNSDTPSDILSERSIIGTEQPSTIPNTKDKFVGNILTELANIKNSMLEASGELIQKQKEATTAYTGKPVPGKKKPSSLYASPYKAWGKAAAVPTPDPLEPVVAKLQYLNQFFDTLLQLEQDATSAANGALTPQQTVKGAKRASDPLDSADPKALSAKSEKILRQLFSSVEAAKDNSISVPNVNQRSIKMAVHQGYQSLPPGSEELLQAGGGGEPDKQEGGGLRLQSIGPMEAQEETSNHHHHHNHGN